MSASILVLEDDPAMRRLLRRQLEGAGHRVRIFGQAAPALDEIDHGASFDLYLLDVRMPAGELHGQALARMINLRVRDARIIFITGDPGLVSAPDKILGPVFAKPIDFIELLKEIQRQLGMGPRSSARRMAGCWAGGIKSVTSGSPKSLAAPDRTTRPDGWPHFFYKPRRPHKLGEVDRCLSSAGIELGAL